MSARHLCSLGLMLVLAGCATAAPAGSSVPAPTQTLALTDTPTPSAAAASFATALFAAISDDPVVDEAAAQYQAVLNDLVGSGGLTATVMTEQGTWTGAAGKADDVRDMRPDDQLAIGSTTKPVIAAQMMQLVEAGEVALDDPVSNYLPPELDFDTNDATIRQLLSMRSGIPDYVDEVWDSLSTDPQHGWTPDEMLAHVPDSRITAGLGSTTRARITCCWA